MSELAKPKSKQMIHRDDALLLDYTERAGQFNMPGNHMHDSYEVYYLLSGRRNYFIKDRLYPIEKGDLVFIPKYDLHRTLASGTAGHERLVINFKETFAQRFAGERGGGNILLYPFEKGIYTFRPQADDRHILEGLIYRMLREIKEKPSGYETYLQALTVEVLLHAARCLEKYETEIEPCESPLHRKVSEIAAYMNENYMKPLTLGHLSERFFLSTFYLSRVFREITGFTFVEYLNHVRIKEAQRLLRDSNLKVLRISEQVGFESIAHFGRVFKQTVGLSPTQYRRMHMAQIR